MVPSIPIYKKIHLTDTTTSGQSEPGSDGNKGLLHTCQDCRTGASPLDAV